MPRNDGTGPVGRGTMTGRGLGWCNDYSGSRIGRKGINKGLGLGCRRGFGRFFYNEEADFKTDKATLEKQKNILEAELRNVNEALKNYTEDTKE